MDLVMCPNGHPNRPGRSQCVVCRAPLVVPATAEATATTTASAAASVDAPTTVAATTPPPNKATTPAPTTSDSTTPTKESKNGGCGRWILLAIIGLIALAVIVGSVLWPLIRFSDEPTVLVEQAAPAEATTVVVIEPVEPTQAPEPTALPATEPLPEPTVVPAEPTAVPPEPTAEPEQPEPTAAATALATEVAGDDSQPLDHGNLITNGDFSERWVDTWSRQVSNNNGVQAVEVVAFENAPAPSGLRMTKTGTGTTLVQQTVDVPRRATELRFTGNLRLVGSQAADGVSEGRVALMLTYFDENGETLGYSVWIDDSQPASDLWGTSPMPEFGPRLSPHFANGEDWQTIDVRLQEEFVNRLPGLSANEVRQIGISLIGLASDTCIPDDCAVTLEVADLQFVPTEME